MMRAVLVAAAVALALVAADIPRSEMPLFTWSHHWTSESVPVEASQPTSVEHAVSTTLKSGAPEVVMVYMLHEVSANQMYEQRAAMPKLQDAVTSSVWSSFKSLPLAKATISDLSATADVYGATTHEVDCDQMKTLFTAKPEILRDGKPDVVVVRFPEGADLDFVDGIVGTAEESVAAVTKKFTSFLSTTSSMNKDSATNLMTFFSTQDLWARPPTVAQSSDLVNNQFAYLSIGSNLKGKLSTRHSLKYGPSTYLTPTLLLAILVMLYAGMLALCAFCCILSLQTPEKFEGDAQKEMSSALQEDKQ